MVIRITGPGHLLMTLAASMLLTSVSLAGETWDGGGANNNWTTGANWNTVRGTEFPPPNDGTADIVMAGTTRLTPRVDVDWDINSLTFNSTAGGLSISGDAGVSLGIGAGGITNNDTQQLQILLLPLVLDASQTWNASAGALGIGNTVAGHPILPRTLTLDGANNINIAGAITTGITLNKTGTGTLTFDGGNTNSYTGTTTVSAGTLALGRTGGPNRAIPGNLIIGDGAGGIGADVVRLDAADQITEAAGRTVTINSSGLLNLNGFNETVANLAINGGSLSGASSLVVNEVLTFTGGGSISAATVSALMSPVAVDSGVLNISSGGDLSNTFGRIGSTAGSNGSVSVSGAGSSWTNSHDLYIGDAGMGTLDIMAGGDVMAGGGDELRVSTIGFQPGSTGRVTVDGIGSTWSSSVFVVGDAGSGLLNIDNGAVASGVIGAIAATAGSMGEVNISNDSQWHQTEELTVGLDGTGILNIIGGHVLTGASLGPNEVFALIGVDSDSNGSVILSDGGEWTAEGEIIVADRGTGSLEIIGGIVSCARADIGRSPGSHGEAMVTGASKWIVNLDAIGSESVLIVGGGGSGTINIASGGEVFANRMLIATGAQSTGTVNVDGSGSELRVDDTLVIGADGVGSLSITNGARVSVGAGFTTIGLNGQLSGNSTIDSDVQNTGLLSPGASPGALSIERDYTQTTDGELLIELASAAGFDQLLVTGETALDGTLTVNLIDGFIPTVGQSFTILTADDIDGTFGTEALPTVPNLVFDVIYNLQSVVLQVLAAALPGDYNGDGAVDAADYVVWRKNPDGFGGSAGYDTWRANFGRSTGNGQAAPGSAGGSNLAVPEPSAATLLLAVLSAAALLRRRKG